IVPNIYHLHHRGMHTHHGSSHLLDGSHVYLDGTSFCRGRRTESCCRFHHASSYYRRLLDRRVHGYRQRNRIHDTRHRALTHENNLNRTLSPTLEPVGKSLPVRMSLWSHVSLKRLSLNSGL